MIEKINEGINATSGPVISDSVTTSSKLAESTAVSETTAVRSITEAEIEKLAQEKEAEIAEYVNQLSSVKKDLDQMKSTYDRDLAKK